MKRSMLLLVALSLFLVAALSACGGGAAPSASTAQQAAPTAAAAPQQAAPTVAAAAPTAAAAAKPAAAPTTAAAPTAAAASGAAPKALSGDPIKIGAAVAQTSNVALFGQEQVLGAQIAEDYFNQHGGINGRPVKIVFQDTAGDEAGTINAFNQLINNDKVVGIIGPTLSQQAFAADPIADKAGVPVIGPSNTAAGIPQIGDYISRVSAPVSVVAPNAIKAALKNSPDVKNVAVLFAQNDAFSKSETGVFQKTITDTLKLNLATVQTFQTTDTDFTTQVTNVLNNKADLVVISGLAADGGNLVKQLRELGYKGPIVGGNGFNTPNIFPVCKDKCDGIYVAQAYSPDAPGAMNEAFRAAFKAKQQGKDPGQFSGQMFAGVQVFIEALQALDKAGKLQTTDLAKLRSDLNKQVLSGKYDTPLGTISFTPEGEINQQQFYVAQIKMSPDGQNGQFVLVK
ncbi:MAG: ABC transporter substrate-binding protein [Anaerolineae bacterium]